MIHHGLVLIVALVVPAFAFANDLDDARAAGEKGDYKEAIAKATLHLKANPDDEAAYLLRGLAHKKVGDHDKAIEDFNAAIRLAPKDAVAYSNRGMVYRLKGDDDKAIADYSEAIRLNPKGANPLLLRGLVHGGRKQYQKAIKDYDQALRIDPKMDDAYVMRALAYRHLRAYVRAVQDYSEAIRLDGSDANRHTLLACLLASCPEESVRNAGKAIEHATKACELSDWKDAESIGVLGAAWAEKGDFAAAVKWQMKALSVGYPDDEQTAAARQRLALYRAKKPYREP